MKSTHTKAWWDDWLDLATRPDMEKGIALMSIHRRGQLHQEMGMVRLIQLPPAPFTVPARIWLDWCIEKKPGLVCGPAPKTKYIPVYILESRPYRIDANQVFISMGTLGHITLTMRAAGVMRQKIETWVLPTNPDVRLEELRT